MVGCGKAPETTASPDTGAKEAVRNFYGAIIGKDWATAYATVHPEGRRGWSREQFTQRAEAYRRYLGFEPKSVRVPILEERGTEATAHLELTGTTTGKGRHDFKDAITLRAVDGRWLVMLPSNFGLAP
jgi:hypothetical protein